METGILGGQALLAGRGADGDSAAVRARYADAIARIKPRFDLYEKANRVNRHPWLADLLIWRASRSPRLLQRMSGVLNETSNPGNLLSIKGFTRCSRSRHRRRPRPAAIRVAVPTAGPPAPGMPWSAAYTARDVYRAH
jgi:hypothetical protein